jgi:periplasmic protein CpxP/Spy
MKKYAVRIATLVLTLGMFVTIAPRAQAQAPAQAQKMQAIAKQLNLTPQQKMQLMPILEADAPKIQAIKSDSSMSGMQKLQQIKAIHAQSDPQVKAILNPQQYEQLQQIRQQEIHEAMEKKMGQQ